MSSIDHTQSHLHAIVIHHITKDPSSSQTSITPHLQHPTHLSVPKESNSSLEALQNLIGTLPKISQKIQPGSGNGQRTIVHQELVIFSQWDSNYVVYAVCDKDYKHRIGYQILDSIFASRDMSKAAIKPVLKKYFVSEENDKILHAHNQIEDIKHEMVKNIDKVLERSNDLDRLEENFSAETPDSLLVKAKRAKKTSAKFSIKTWVKDKLISRGDDKALRKLEKEAASRK